MLKNICILFDIHTFSKSYIISTYNKRKNLAKMPHDFSKVSHLVAPGHDVDHQPLHFKFIITTSCEWSLEILGDSALYTMYPSNVFCVCVCMCVHVHFNHYLRILNRCSYFLRKYQRADSQSLFNPICTEMF